MRQDIDRQNELQPKRMAIAKKEIEKLGYPIINQNGVMLQFDFKGETVTYFAYSGWASGKTIKDGRGLQKLLIQIR